MNANLIAPRTANTFVDFGLFGKFRASAQINRLGHERAVAAAKYCCPTAFQMVPGVAPETRKLTKGISNYLILFFLLGTAMLHPMQVRYQAALRPELTNGL